ncbi:Cell division protein SepF [Candidatus Gugararchaeum adminiculabundum]|nr:Cell division protein SepF [Candidatus Gugararchaeum adminiculabundum]
MSIIKKLTGALGVNKDTDIEEYMDAVELENVDVLHEAADFYIKPVALENEDDVKVITQELAQKNIILLNIAPMARNAAALKSILAKLKDHVGKMNGDMARIDNDKILLTPTKVKIVKSRKG